MLQVKRLRLVTFDVTETLLNFRTSPAEKYAQVGAQFGVHVDPGEITSNFKQQFRGMSVSHPNFGYKTGLGWEKWWKQLIRRTFEATGKCTHIDGTILDRIGDHLLEIYKTAECWEVMKGAHQLLSHLNTQDIALGIISNNDERLETVLMAMDLRHYFQFVINSYSAGFEKPDVRILELAMYQLGNKTVKANEALHVGNSPALDYMGAINAGWNAALVHQNATKVTHDHQDINPEFVFETLQDLQSYITKLQLAI
ncbi:rhythmically expressed gene 2 protein-like [Periplaneta americana]|uniref:rhythmically expressed gene 2 protein-like n=1 Tax=Periplaneta americana TaxID=6978 RepID=UPI0037E70A5F